MTTIKKDRYIFTRPKGQSPFGYAKLSLAQRNAHGQMNRPLS